jgi:hypothetical protein
VRREHSLKALLAASFLFLSCLALLVGIQGGRRPSVLAVGLRSTWIVMISPPFGNPDCNTPCKREAL